MPNELSEEICKKAMMAGAKILAGELNKNREDYINPGIHKLIPSLQTALEEINKKIKIENQKHEKEYYHYPDDTHILMSAYVAAIEFPNEMDKVHPFSKTGLRMLRLCKSYTFLKSLSEMIDKVEALNDDEECFCGLSDSEITPAILNVANKSVFSKIKDDDEEDENDASNQTETT